MLPLHLYARVRLLFAQIARETAGAASTRSFLCPLFLRRSNEDANSGDQRREIVKSYSTVIVREGGRSSIPEALVIELIRRGVLDHPPSRAPRCVCTPHERSEAAALWIASLRSQ